VSIDYLSITHRL